MDIHLYVIVHMRLLEVVEMIHNGEARILYMHNTSVSLMMSFDTYVTDNAPTNCI